MLSFDLTKGGIRLDPNPRRLHPGAKDADARAGRIVWRWPVLRTRRASIDVWVLEDYMSGERTKKCRIQTGRPPFVDGRKNFLVGFNTILNMGN
ncbi:hypothetical protein NL676_001282 [Syzygium grande]|nr:hypothetical protein NL676_001282 [Syzygium grande]